MKNTFEEIRMQIVIYDIFRGWWFPRGCNSSITANLNGVWHADCVSDPPNSGIQWNTWKGANYSLFEVSMKVKPETGNLQYVAVITLTVQNFTVLDFNYCIWRPDICKNGGSCTHGVNGYACACAPGYSGTNCEKGKKMDKANKAP